MNEATLEARIHAVLDVVFPTFREVKIVHQKSFTVKFGHHTVSVDLNDPKSYSKAVFDILLTIADKPIMLLELKKEGLALTNEDRDQGLSYARLVHPMPPILLLSNGYENKLYNTYTKELLEKDALDIVIIQSLIDSSFRLATKDLREAIDFLLNREGSLFAKVLTRISQGKFAMITGKIAELSKTIVEDFQVERKLVNEVFQLNKDGQNLIGIIAPAFYGKTNLLFQVYSKCALAQGHFVFFIDCKDHNYSIFQQLANEFSRELSFAVSRDKVHDWLNASIRHIDGSRFFILIDNFNDDIPEPVKEEIIELIDLFKETRNSLIYTIDEFSYKKLAHIEDRKYTTIIGQRSKLLMLDEFDIEEYSSANELLFRKFNASIGHGGQFAVEYRHPRIIRQMAIAMSSLTIKSGLYAKIHSIPNVDSLRHFANSEIFTNSVRKAYAQLATAFIKDIAIHHTNSDLHIAAAGNGAVQLSTYKALYGKDHKKLVRSGLVIVREYKDGLTLILPKIPELLAVYGIDLIEEIILKEYDGTNINAVCSHFLELVSGFPYGDLVACGVLIKLGRSEHYILFSQLVQRLMDIPPRLDGITAGTRVVLFSEDFGHLYVNFEDDMGEEGFIGDFFPYIILSLLCELPMGLANHGDNHALSFHLHLLNKIASSKFLLVRPYMQTFRKIQPVLTFQPKKVGTITSGKEGIVEPIVQSIQECVFKIPDVVERLYEDGMADRNFILLWRVYLAVREFYDSPHPELYAFASKFKRSFDPLFADMMADILADDDPDPSFREKLKMLTKDFQS
ncbi:MAG: type I restriction enzyme HsdR N-terminal domain-containing protein [Sphingobacteriales bacterium]|nr:type I restriction enzyme HsdR N-terminal domain-containing protein [Sphingobacteriales bacterium]